MNTNSFNFVGPLSKHCESFIAWKRSGGLKYEAEYDMLRRFDKFTCDYIFPKDTLPRNIVEKWCIKREHEHPRTQCSRIRVVKLLALYMSLRGYDAYVTCLPSEVKSRRMFHAHIYTDSELKLIFNEIDNLNPKRYPIGHVQYPVLFRLYYSAGLRLSEGYDLRIKDVDFLSETIFIRNTKFGKSRIVPLNHEMFLILKRYIEKYCTKQPDDYVFPRSGQKKPQKTIGSFFIRLVRRVGIYHGGKSKGVRIHDFRHTFAVRSMRNAYLAGEDMTNFMPYLSAYMGHADLRGTELYLQLTADIYPEITKRFSDTFSNIYPTENNHEEK